MEKSWILINPAIREGLPNSYLEAAAHQTAILSYVNPDDFASRFGFHAATDNFEEGLTTLLKNNYWKHRPKRDMTMSKILLPSTKPWINMKRSITNCNVVSIFS